MYIQWAFAQHHGVTCCTCYISHEVSELSCGCTSIWGAPRLTVHTHFMGDIKWEVHEAQTLSEGQRYTGQRTIWVSPRGVVSWVRGGVCLSGNVSRRCGKAEVPGSPLLPGWYSCQAAGTYSPSMRRVPGHLHAVPVLVVCCLAGPWWWEKHQLPPTCSRQCAGDSGQPGAVLSVPWG